MKSTILLVTLLFSSSVLSAEYPALLDIIIGEPFGHPQGAQNRDEAQPTTQFRAPNHGPTAEFFPEFSVTYLNDSNEVAIVTAERVTASLNECQGIKDEWAKLVQTKFPNHLSASMETSQLQMPGEYSQSGNNFYYILRCQGSYGPFHYLHFQMRGIAQDEKLRSAWAERFGA